MSEKRIIKVYVAGAYSDNNVLGVLRNIGRGEYYSAKLFMLGFAPFCPWHDKDFVIKNWDKELNKSKFMNDSLAWMKVSDAIFVVPNYPELKDWENSNGVLREIDEAYRLKIPVFFAIKELINYNFEANPCPENK